MLRQMTDTLGPLPEGAFEQAKKEIGSPLPEEHKRLLLRYNGGRTEPACFPVTWEGQSWAKRFPYDTVHFLFGFREGSPSDLLDNLETYRGRIPDDTLPIGRDPGGNLLLIGFHGANTGKVYLWLQDHEVEEGEVPDYSNIGLIASSFDEFLDSLYDK